MGWWLRARSVFAHVLLNGPLHRDPLSLGLCRNSLTIMLLFESGTVLYSSIVSAQSDMCVYVDELQCDDRSFAKVVNKTYCC